MMTTRTRFLSTLLATGVGTALALGTGAALAASGDTDGDVGASTTVTAEVSESLQLNLEEERMARDLYDGLGEAHDGLAPFVRIEDSEQRHHDAVARLITLKGGTLPGDAVAGQFVNDDIQARYDDWLARGLTSPEAAFEVGIELEMADIEHLRSTIDAIDDPDVDRVLGHLLNASEHHLAAFEAAAAGKLPAMAGDGGGRQGGPGDPGGPGRHSQGAQGRGGPHHGAQDQGGQHHGDRTGDCPMAATDED